MTVRCIFTLSRIMLAALPVGVLGAGPAAAGDFLSYFNRYVPSSIRSEIESHLDRSNSAKPSRERTPQLSNTAATPSGKIAPAGTAILAPAMLASNRCLSQRHLATGAVLFKDSCTKEWAINSTPVSDHAVDRKCLRKTLHPDGIVVFRNYCTEEWAMNKIRTAPGLAEPHD
jgi:hypothetical protein